MPWVQTHGFTTPSPPTSLNSDSCWRCGEPFDSGGRWYAGQAGFEHTHCADWASRDFPFTAEVTRLRKKWRALKAATKAVEQAGRWLRAFERRWPADAAKGVEEWLALKAKVEALIFKSRE